MSDVADGPLLEVEMLDERAREFEKAFDVFAEDLRAFVVGEDLDEPAEPQSAKNVARGFGSRKLRRILRSRNSPRFRATAAARPRTAGGAEE